MANKNLPVKKIDKIQQSPVHLFLRVKEMEEQTGSIHRYSLYKARMWH